MSEEQYDETASEEREGLIEAASEALEGLDLSEEHIAILLAAEGEAEASLLPYHNLHHCTRVAVLYLAFTEYGFTREDRRHGYLAALYHDAAHPGDPDDSVNTAASAAFFATNAPEDEGIDRDYVCELIRGTTAGATNGQSDDVSKAISDADLIQTVFGSAELRSYWQQALSDELSIEVTESSSIDFLRGKFHTIPGRVMFSIIEDNPHGLRGYPEALIDLALEAARVDHQSKSVLVDYIGLIAAARQAE